MKQFTSARTTLAAALTLSLIAGCATAPARPRGAVVPMEGGRWQSAVKAGDSQAALKTFTHDAEVTCAKGETGPRMPWEAKPAPAKYAVISQAVKDKEGKEVKSSGRVEMWRGGRRSRLSVGRPFRLAVPEYPRRNSVSTSPSSNRTCGSPASGSLPLHQALLAPTEN